MNQNSFEPTLRMIDDYRGDESKEKRQTIRFVIISLLIVGLSYSVAVKSFLTVDDQIAGVPDLAKRF